MTRLTSGVTHTVTVGNHPHTITPPKSEIERGGGCMQGPGDALAVKGPTT